MYDSQPDFQVSAWLDGLGLGQYAEAFAANDINSRETLAALNESDLEKLGVASLGHRKQLLTAIDTLQPKPLVAAPSPRPQEVIINQAPAPPPAPKSSGCGVWQIVAVLLIILLVIIIASTLGL
jgi:hypothetical protein